MSQMRSVGFRLLGIFLAGAAFFPVRTVFGEVKGAAFLVPPGEWLLGLLVFGVLAWLVAASPLTGKLKGVGRSAGWLEKPSRGPMVGVALVGLAFFLSFVSASVFAHRPLLVDSIAQLFQAKIFAGGMLTAPAPAEPAFFNAQHLLVDEGRWYAQYPPGHAALLAVGVALGLPWLVPVCLSVATAWFLYRFAATAYGEGTARLTFLLVLLCPFLWFMGASFMNHVSSLFFIALALWLVARWESEDRGDASLVGAGLAGGAALLCRPLTALAVGAVLGGVVAATAFRRGRWRGLGAAALACVGVAGLYLAWNAATTGDPFLTGYVKLWGDAHGLGFHATPWGGVHTVAAGLQNELVDLSLLALYLFEWPIPALLPAAALFAFGADCRWDRRLLLCFFAVPAAYFFYWHRDAYLGPRFLYSTVAFILPLTARGLQEGWKRLRGWRPGGQISFLRPDGGAFIVALVVLCFAYGLFYGAPRRFEVYESGMASLKVDLVQEARQAGIEEGLLFVAVNWGNRLIMRLRAADVEVATVERVYRTVDHCELQRLLDRATSEDWPPQRLTAAAVELSLRQEPVVRTASLNADPYLRILPGRPLAPSCEEQLEYDAADYTVYAPHLLANDPRLSGRIVVARDLRARNSTLRRRYPDRPAFLYRGGRFHPITWESE